MEKPGLSAENVAKRLAWAEKYKNWTIKGLKGDLVCWASGPYISRKITT